MSSLVIANVKLKLGSFDVEQWDITGTHMMWF